jgi:DNA-binding CsgD family transcriptional regulator
MNQREVYQAKLDSLTEQPKKVLRHMLDGKTDKEIAKSLVIAEGTVRTYIKNIIEHFGIESDKYLPNQRCPRRGKLIELCKKYNIGISDFYVERPPIESICYETLLRPGSLIRIKASSMMGKTLLINRVLAQVKAKQGYRTVNLNLKLADRRDFNDLNKFLRWFCKSVSRELGLPSQLEDYWEEGDGSKSNCTTYFEEYLLKAADSPLVLCLDDVDVIFPYPEIYEDFFDLLRFWYERAKSRPLWKRLRLVVVHSTEVYITLNINKSPFNVGVPIELSEFTPKQVQDFAKQHGLDWNAAQVEKLMAMVGGHPYLVQQAIAHLKNHPNITLEQLLETAPTEAGIYSNRLREHLLDLQQHPELVAALKEVVMATNPVRIETIAGHKLQSRGLVKRQSNEVMPSCDLYRLYFSERLGDS